MTALNTQHYESQHSCSHTNALGTSKFRLKKLTDALLVSTVLASLSLTAQAADEATGSATTAQSTESVEAANAQAACQPCAERSRGSGRARCHAPGRCARSSDKRSPNLDG